MNPLIRFLKDLTYIGLEAFGKYYSVYRGVVADNLDPNNLQRLKLAIPEITGDQVHDYWAYPTGVFAGKGYGHQILPRIGDIVWVEFEHGNPEVPVWKHGYLGNGEFPTGDDDLKDPDCFWFISPKGHKIKINDTKKYIKIETLDGKYIELNPNSVSVVNKIISLGTLDKSKEPGVLGDQNVKAFDIVQGYMDDLNSALKKDIKMSTLAGQPFLMYSNLASATTKLDKAISDLKTQLPKTLSKVVTLD